MILSVYNPSTDNLEKSYLSQAYAVGQNSFVVKNNNLFVANARVMLGEMGREKTEILTVNTVNSDGITFTTTAASKFPHSADDPVYVLRYDQVKIYRSTTGIGGSYSILATVALDVDNATLMTTYDDTAGLSTYFYETTYYASIAAIESAPSDPIAGAGYSRKQVGSIVNSFFLECQDLDQTYVTVPMCVEWINEANDDLSSQSARPYRFLRKNPDWLLSTTAGNNRITLPADMTFIDYILYNYQYGGFTQNPQIDIVDMNEINYLISQNGNLVNNSDELQAVAIDTATGELVLYPTPLTSQTNVFTIYGWTSFTEVTGLGGTVQTPNGRIYKMFLLSKFWKVRSIKEDKFKALAAAYQTDYTTEIVKLQRSNKVDKGTPTGMKPDRNYLGVPPYGSQYRT